MKIKIFAILAIAGLTALASAKANAAIIVFRPVPVYAPVAVYEPVPVYVQRPVIAYDPARFAGPNDIQGVLTSAVPYHLTIRINDQFYPVLEHNGTIINPTGTTLAPSMIVNIAGWWDRFGVFHANQINVLRY
ncbi:MAG TPA: hypothetical protein VEJ41_04810 [Candidatus Acidoferrales bacterium]|nr:hypothetical protein [Candidatus Acidoferrales bacterium]